MRFDLIEKFQLDCVFEMCVALTQMPNRYLETLTQIPTERQLNESKHFQERKTCQMVKRKSLSSLQS